MRAALLSLLASLVAAGAFLVPPAVSLLSGQRRVNLLQGTYRLSKFTYGVEYLMRTQRFPGSFPSRPPKMLGISPRATSKATCCQYYALGTRSSFTSFL